MTDKLLHIVDGKLETFHHANTFAREKTSGPERVRIGPRGGQRYLFEHLAKILGPSYKVRRQQARAHSSDSAGLTKPILSSVST